MSGASLPLPPPCTGFNPDIKQYQSESVTFVRTEFVCPKGEAMLFHQFVLGRDRGPDEVAPSGNCCPVYEGALLDEHRYERVSCSDGYVITGGRMLNPPPEGTRDPRPFYEIRCTRVDPARFVLGPLQPGLSIDYGRSPGSMLPPPFRREERLKTGWNMVPARLRFGMGRVSRTQWIGSGCVGHPWGSVLTSLGQRECSTFIFRELLPRGSVLREIDRTGAPIPEIGGIDNLSNPIPPPIR